MAKRAGAQGVTNFDLEADAKETAPQVGDNQLKAIAAAGTELVEAEREVAELEEALRAAKERLLYIKRRTLPDLMEAVHLGEFRLDTGQGIEVKDIIVGALPSKDKEPAAYAASMEWLRVNAADIVKTEVGISFGKGQGKVAKAFFDLAAKFSKDQKQKTLGLVPEADEGIHYQTLQKWLRERLAAGTVSTIPSTVFASFYMGKEAKVIKE